METARLRFSVNDSRKRSGIVYESGSSTLLRNTCDQTGSIFPEKDPSKTIHKQDSREYLSQAEAARRRGVSNQAIAELIRRGRLTPVEVAGRTVVLRSEIEGFVARPKFGNPPKKATSKKASQKAKPKK